MNNMHESTCLIYFSLYKYLVLVLVSLELDPNLDPQGTSKRKKIGHVEEERSNDKERREMGRST